MKKFKAIFASTIFLLFSWSIYAQTIEKLNTAENLLSKYLIASKFEENGKFTMNEHTRKDFTELFSKDATIIFDIPIANQASAKSSLKRYESQERHQSSFITVFGKEVSPEMYVATLDKVLESQIKIHVLPTGKNDITRIDSAGIALFEIEKSFQEKDSLTNTYKYFVEIDISGQKPLITGIRKNNENILKRDVIIHLFNDGRAVTNANTFTCIIHMEYPEKINNTIDTIQSEDGQIRLDQLANRATIKIKKANDREAVDYQIPNEWRDKGKRISEQPDDGFELNLLPLLWKGWSYSFDVQGGVFQQSQVNTGNFNSDSSKFTNDPGYNFGVEFLITKYFNPRKWKQSGWLFGIGIGLAANYGKASTSSENFLQNRYKFVDAVNDECEIEYKGTSFKETITRVDIGLPVFIDFRARLGKKTSITIQPGINVTYPFQFNAKAEGNFSRWGYYSFNEYDKPMTDDPVYNYFTNEAKTYDDEGAYSLQDAGTNSLQLEGQLRLNFLLHVFNKNPDNALIIGLVGKMPFTNSETYTYTTGRDEGRNYTGYWISTENEEYHSLVHSRNKPYDFFIGLSVGINLVKYKAK